MAQRPGGPVATVTVDNPAKANTLNTALMDEFIAAFARLAQDADLRAAVLTGRGPAHLHGRRRRARDGGAGRARGRARAFITRLHRCCAAVRDLPVPVVARVNGPASAPGWNWWRRAICAWRWTRHGFAMPEVKLGIPSVIEAALLPGLVGWGRTRHMLLLGEPFGAAEAERWGLVEQVVPAAGLDAALDGWLDSLLACPPGAVRSQKALMRRWEDVPLRDAIAAGVDRVRGCPMRPASRGGRWRGSGRSGDARRAARPASAYRVPSTASSRATASRASAGLTAKQIRTIPSPSGPNAVPGATPTFASRSSRNARSRLVSPVSMRAIR